MYYSASKQRDTNKKPSKSERKAIKQQRNQRKYRHELNEVE